MPDPALLAYTAWINNRYRARSGAPTHIPILTAFTAGYRAASPVSSPEIAAREYGPALLPFLDPSDIRDHLVSIAHPSALEPLCPRCSSPLHRLPAEPDDPEVGVAATRSGLWCDTCETLTEDDPPGIPDRPDEEN